MKKRPSDSVEKSNIIFEKSEIVIQNKDKVLRNLANIDKDILRYTKDDVSKLRNDEKLKILEAFGKQSASSGLGKVLDFYKDKIKEDKIPDDIDEMIGNLLSLMNNYKITDLKLESVMDGVLARGTSRRGLDFKKNLDVSLGGVAEMNDKAWEKTQGFMKGYMDKIKDAPVGVKGLMLAGTAFASLVGYYVLTAKDEKTKEPYFLSKVLKVGLIAFGGFAAGNMLSKINKRELPKDYENLNKYIKAKDYAEFLLNREPNDSESESAGAFIESVYNPKIHQLEFSELLNTVQKSKANSSEWINMVDGKGVDVAKTHAGITMFVNRYDPAYKGLESIYNDPEVDDRVKEEMKALWNKVSVDKQVGDELSYRDVVMRFLALDSKFTFENKRSEGNERYKKQEKYEAKQAKYKELERISGLDFATGWLKTGLNDPDLSEFLDSAPFSEDIAGVWPDFMGLFHRAQGEISDLYVNIDEISDQREFEKYKTMSNDLKFSTFKKRISFKDSISFNKGSKIIMRQSHEPSNDSYLKYDNSIAVPSREEFFENFSLKDNTTGKLLKADSEALKYITMDPRKQKTKPERIVFPSEVEIEAKKNVNMSDYVLYGYAIKFE